MSKRSTQGTIAQKNSYGKLFRTTSTDRRSKYKSRIAFINPATPKVLAPLVNDINDQKEAAWSQKKKKTYYKKKVLPCKPKSRDVLLPLGPSKLKTKISNIKIPYTKDSLKLGTADVETETDDTSTVVPADDAPKNFPPSAPTDTVPATLVQESLLDKTSQECVKNEMNGKELTKVPKNIKKDDNISNRMLKKVYNLIKNIEKKKEEKTENRERTDDGIVSTANLLLLLKDSEKKLNSLQEDVKVRNPCYKNSASYSSVVTGNPKDEQTMAIPVHIQSRKESHHSNYYRDVNKYYRQGRKKLTYGLECSHAEGKKTRVFPTNNQVTTDIRSTQSSEINCHKKFNTSSTSTSPFTQVLGTESSNNQYQTYYQTGGNYSHQATIVNQEYQVPRNNYYPNVEAHNYQNSHIIPNNPQQTTVNVQCCGFPHGGYCTHLNRPIAHIQTSSQAVNTGPVHNHHNLYQHIHPQPFNTQMNWAPINYHLHNSLYYNCSTCNALRQSMCMPNQTLPTHPAHPHLHF